MGNTVWTRGLFFVYLWHKFLDVFPANNIAQATRSETLSQPHLNQPKSDVWAQRALGIVDNCAVTAKLKLEVPWNSKVPPCPDFLSLFSLRDRERLPEIHRGVK